MRIKRPLGQAEALGPKRLTLRPLHDAQPLEGTAELVRPRPNNRVGGRMSKQEIAQALMKPARLAAIRAYRAGMHEAIQWARLGLITPKDGSLLVGMYGKAAELLLTEKILEAAGQTDVEPALHPLGPDGGFETMGAPGTLPTQAKQTKIERTIGVGPDGNPIDVTKVEIIGGEELTDLVPALGSLDATPEEEN